MAITWVLWMLANWELRIELPPGSLPAALFLALIFLQTTPLSIGLVRLLAPWTVSLYETAAASTGIDVSFVPLSLAPYATWREGLKLAAVAVFLFLLHNTYRTRAQVHRAIWTMVGMGTMISVFGIVQRMSWNGRFYWIGPEAPVGASYAFGPFVNRAQFAGLIVIVVPMALGFILARRKDTPRSSQTRSRAEVLRQWICRDAGPTALASWLILVMGGAALVSGSRGGILALIAALLSMVMLRACGRSGARRAAPVALTIGLIFLTGLWIGADVFSGTLERFVDELRRPGESYRLRIWPDAVRLWQNTPLLGTGLATFDVAFPPVRTLNSPLIVTHAESDWLQLLTDTGIIGFGLASTAVGALGCALLQCYRRASNSEARNGALAGLVALIGTAVQGAANYNLPVMANLLYLSVAVAVALGGRRGGDTCGPR
jgi:O-antigen ligase